MKLFGSKEASYIVSNNTRIYYQSFGDGIPVIMLHGNMQNSSFFKHQIKTFKDQFRVITVDSRGHGASEFCDRTLTLDVLALDVVNLIEALHLSKVMVLGFSDGGNIAIKLAGLIPQHLVAIVAVSPNVHPKGIKKWVKRPAEAMYYIFSKLGWINWFDKKAQILALMIHEPNIGLTELEHMKVPMLILTGEYDIIHRKHIRAIHHYLPISKLVVLEKGGHKLLKTHATKVNKIILEFLHSFDNEERQ